MAAAYAALVSVLNNLEDIQNHPHHSFSFDHSQMQSLHRSVGFLIDFMESYDNSHGVINEAAQLLESEITRAAHDAEQVIESHINNQILARETASSFPADLQKVIKGMDFVMTKAAEMQSELEVMKEQLTVTHSAAATPFIISEKISTVGFDDVLLQLMDMLTGEPSLRVISIVGMAGIGKTTLAKNAFQHSLIVKHFDVCLWATITQQYDVGYILSKLLFHQGKSNVGNYYHDQLGEELHKRLYGRRYLIVLDDIWCVEAWEKIRLFFPDTRDGSRIIVTTRQSDVAQQLDSSCLALGALGEDKSWDLFCQKAFAEEGCPPNLEDVGKKIVKKCKGLPLAIVVVAGHLGKSSRRQEYWENVSYNMNLVLNSEENKHVFDILSFSYSHLPIHLKPCFVYMGTFKEDKEILASDLIKTWIAEGFLKPCKGNNWENIAKDYLKNLIDRNLILVKKRLAQGQIILVGIHDLLRELCIKVAEKEMFFGTPRDICREELFVINKQKRKRNPRLKYGGLGRQVASHIWNEEPFELRLRRVLNMVENIKSKAYESFFIEADIQQVNLRFLKYKGYYSSSRSVRLPSSISRLWNLQTLIIELGSGSGSITAPYEVWQLLQLRHLESTGIHLPDPLPNEQGNDLVIGSLQTLGHVHNLKLSEEVCKRIPNIKELRVTYTDLGEECDVRSYYCPHNLGCFSKLESLECRFGGNASVCREFALTLSLSFPSRLKRLCLSGCCLDWEEMAMAVGSFPGLESLELDENSVVGSKWSHVEGKFLGLKSLRVSHCDELVRWEADYSDFPVLKDLLLEGLSRLEEFPSCIGEIPSLESITLKGCSVLVAVSAMRMLVEQEEQGNEIIKLGVFFRGKEKESFNKMVQQAGLQSTNLRVLTKEEDKW